MKFRTKIVRERYWERERDIMIEKEEVFLAALGQYSAAGPLSIKIEQSKKGNKKY